MRLKSSPVGPFASISAITESRSRDVTGTGSRVLVNTNTFTASSSGGLLLTFANDWKSGTKVRFTTTTTLPTGLALATDYWLVRVSATTARVATSYANYVAGTVVAFTDGGTGTHTLTIQMPRYDSGVGCEAFFAVKTQPTAGGPTVSASSYTNTAGTAGRAFQGSVTLGATADAYAGRILHSGNAAGRYGAFLPKQGGDTGIRSVESFTWSAGTAYTDSNWGFRPSNQCSRLDHEPTSLQGGHLLPLMSSAASLMGAFPCWKMMSDLLPLYVSTSTADHLAKVALQHLAVRAGG